MRNPCTVGDCVKPQKAFGYCPTHYAQFKRTGSVWQRPTVEERFFRLFLLSDDSGCWSNDTQRQTYAEFEGMSAHRWAYEHFVGPIPDGLQLDHLCRNTHCANPSHLEPVTAQENLRRSTNFVADNMRKTHCPTGHPYSDQNTRMTSGKRTCIQCKRAESTRQNRKRRAKPLQEVS